MAWSEPVLKEMNGWMKCCDRGKRRLDASPHSHGRWVPRQFRLMRVAEWTLNLTVPRYSTVFMEATAAIKELRKYLQRWQSYIASDSICKRKVTMRTLWILY